MKSLYYALICVTVAGLLIGCGEPISSGTAASHTRTRKPVGARTDNSPPATDAGVAADPADRLLQLSGQLVRARLEAAREQNPQARAALRAREAEINKHRMQVYHQAASGRPE